MKLFIIFLQPSEVGGNLIDTTPNCCCYWREVVGGKPAKAGGDVPLPQKSDREGALFAVLRAHGYRLRTCSRRPTAQPTRPKEI